MGSVASPDARALSEFAATIASGEEPVDAVKSSLREYRHRYLLHVLWREVAGTARLEETLGALSELADQLLVAATGYAERMLNLRVEFAQAGSSSLDLVVIADFDGSLGDLYNRLRRSLQRWCVEACSENGWEIPFTQLVLHQAAPAGSPAPGASAG